MKKDLSIIILNWNTKDLVLNCVESIIKTKPKVSYEIIVVDNGSTDGSVSALRKTERIKLIENKGNLGFSKANNRGIKKAKGKYILLLNSDTKVTEGAIDALYEFALSTPDAGVVGGELLNKDGTRQKSVFHFPTTIRAILEFWFGEKGTFALYEPKGEKPQKVDSVVGAAFLITPKARQKAGLLNEKYFMYYEDLDYCRKIQKLGLKTYFVPGAKIIHYHGASGRKITKKEFQWERLIPSSKIYHGNLVHIIINFVLWSGQKLGKIILPFFLILLIIPAVWKLGSPGFFTMQDDLQAFRVYEMNKCFDDLQIPCRWVPDAGYQYGYPQFLFYPPLPYYIGAGLHRLGIQYIDSVKILFIAGYALSALSMYLLVTTLTNRWSGFVAATLYTYIPYKAVEVYVRGAMSEFWAQIFFPLIFWSTYKLIKEGKAKYIVLFAVFSGMLSTTHSLMTVIFVPVVGVWSLFWLIFFKFKNLGRLLAGGLLGFGMSAFFTLPVIFERQYAHLESLLSGYFDYRQHFVSLYKTFLSMEWGYGSSGFPNEKLNLSLGLTAWIFGLLFTPILAVFSHKRKKKISLLVLVLVLLSIFTIFMTHLKSSFIWAKLPFLWYMQFPWRFLAVSIFLLCTLLGLGIYLLGRFKFVLGLGIIAISMALYLPFFTPKNWLYITDKEKFSDGAWEKQLTISIFDYLPIYAKLPPWQKAQELPEVLAGNVDFLNYKKGSNYQTGSLLAKENSLIRLPLFDFPGMGVKIDGQKVPHRHDNCQGERYCLGLITFNVPEGRHEIFTKLYDTPVRKIGDIITFLSLAIGGYIGLKLKLNEKKIT